MWQLMLVAWRYQRHLWLSEISEQLLWFAKRVARFFKPQLRSQKSLDFFHQASRH